MADTTEERLERVSKAIEDLLDSGQSVSYNGRTFTMANLKELTDLEHRLELRIERKSRGGIRVRRGTPE